MFAIRRGPWKLIDGLGSGGFTKPGRITPAPGQPEWQLYNLADDPREERDVYVNNPQVAAALRKELDAVRSSP
jgi:hypothetical protein